MKRKPYTPEELKAYDAAQFKTSLEMLKNRTGKYGGVMAGSALLAMMAPTVASMVDDQQESFLGNLASGITTASGAGIGGYYGLKGSTFTPAEVDAMVNQEVARLKALSKAEAKNIGPQAAIDAFARSKQRYIEGFQPIGNSARAQSFNRQLKRDFGFLIPPEMIDDINIMARSPRQLAGMSRGALLGSLAAALPSYLFLRQGEIE